MLCVGSSVDDLTLEWDVRSHMARPLHFGVVFSFGERKMRTKSLQMRFVDKADDNKRNALDVKYALYIYIYIYIYIIILQ